MKKPCSICHEMLPLSEFYTARFRRDGSRAHYPYCKPCSREIGREAASKRQAAKDALGEAIHALNAGRPIPKGKVAPNRVLERTESEYG